MAISPVKAPVATPAPTQAPVEAASKFDLIMAQLAKAPAAKASALDVMVRQVCKSQGIDFDGLSAGKKAAKTRSVKQAAKDAGVSLD